MKKHFLLATALAAIIGCTSDEFMGLDTSPKTSNTPGAIQFASNTPNITRSTGATAAEELGYSFAVYATKTVGETTSNVFAHNTYSATSNTPYWVWYNTGTANTTQSNTYNWEYVGQAGNKTIPGDATFNLATAQEIKYWDYAADNYVFTAYKNKSGGTVSNVTANGFTFEGNASQFAGLYVADKLSITTKANPAAHTTADNKIGDVVKFNFRSAAAKVRLGIYETIPGYQVKNVNFKPTSPANFTATTANAQLSGSFNGSGASSTQTFTVTYGEGGVAQLATEAAVSNDYTFGTFNTSETNYLGTTSTAPTWATGTSNYINVLPNTDNFGAMTLNVDFDLYNANSGETIHVTDAKAVVPAMYMTWKPNFAYTYLFKISDNTNGYTGPQASPSGLYPITFDAVTVATAEAGEQGTITTLTTPSITTYQNGSVSTDGITYAHAKGAIYITVNNDGTLATLNATGTTIKLYTVSANTTEADLLLASGYPKTEVTTGTDAISILNVSETVGTVSFAANTTAMFTPTANQTYALEYKTATETVYKIISIVNN